MSMFDHYRVRSIGCDSQDDLNEAHERGWKLHTVTATGEVVFERRPECGDEVYNEPFGRDEVEQETWD